MITRNCTVCRKELSEERRQAVGPKVKTCSARCSKEHRKELRRQGARRQRAAGFSARFRR